MKKEEKSGIIAKLRLQFQKSESVFIINQNRMTVAETEALRRLLRDAGSVFYVAKNTLAKLAVEGTSFKIMQRYLVGQTSLVFSKDITGSAKVIVEYASKSDDKINIVCGGYSGRLLSAAEIKILSQLPSMDELRAQIVAIVNTPAQRIATLLSTPARQLATVLKAHSDK
ncbi:MAG: 50S ribosomal protein L10 [Holosporaceae bacterium]|nr:50S ribosomal protein L10 [Holosporaceae bacterium]